MGGGKGSGLTYFVNGQCRFLTKQRWVGCRMGGSLLREGGVSKGGELLTGGASGVLKGCGLSKGGWLVSERTGVVQRAGVGF